MGNMQVYSAGGAGSSGSVEPSAVPAGGRLFVTPAYMQTSGAVPVRLDSPLKVAGWDWVQEVDCAYTSLSIHLANVAVAGTLNITLRTVNPSNGQFITLLDTSLPSGDVDDVWIRKIFDPVQCYRGRPYFLDVGVLAGVDVSLSAHPADEASGSAFPDACGSGLSVNGGTAGSYEPIMQDGKFASLNFVMQSTVHHCPQLVYGRHTGKCIPLYNGTTWKLVEIPAGGLFLPMENLVGGTPQVWIRLVDGLPELGLGALEDWRDLQDGVEVIHAMPDCRFLGIVFQVERQPNYWGPIDVMDFRGLAYRGMKKVVGKYCPYAAQVTESVAVGANVPDKWNANDDFAFFVAGLDGPPAELEIHGTCHNDNGATALHVGLAWGDPQIPETGWGTALPGYGPAEFVTRVNIGEGLYSLIPIRWIPAAGTLNAAYYKTGADPDVRAEVVGTMTA